MSRLLALWLTLLAAFWLTRAAASALLFEAAGGGYGEAFQLVTVPALQALLVAWATRRPGPFPHSAPVRLALRQSDLRAILLFDAAVLVAGWIFLSDPWAGPWLGLAQGRNLPNAWIALKAGAAGVILVRSSRDRWILALAAGSLVLAGLVLAGLVSPSPDRLLPWLARHGALLAAGTALALEAQRRLRREGRPAAALALDWAVGLALLAGMTAVLRLAPAAATLGSLAATALLAAARIEEDQAPDSGLKQR
jgi:hypothetical protein